MNSIDFLGNFGIDDQSVARVVILRDSRIEAREGLEVWLHFLQYGRHNG